MNICCAQVQSVFQDPEASLAAADGTISQAVDRGSDLIIFPEQFATGWDPQSTAFAEEEGGPIERAWCRMAEEHGVWIAGSQRTRSAAGINNTALLAAPNGSVHARYAKTHLFRFAKEDMHYTAGDRLSVCSCDGLTVGLAICYDLRFPELFRRYADLGVDCMLVQAAWPCSRIDVFTLFLHARAVENQYYVAGASAVGTNQVDQYCGRSAIVDPLGKTLCSAGEEETCIIAQVDAGYVDSVRKRFPFHEDARYDLLG
ncbi:MAG: carbon-nitrogen hydrolase family protein [Methanocalculus sp. MSAO_Arc1]|uniref:nitrilase-related carbon-nitrogen hydrolase n=1 Tax=Methanocalculus TaxID=71151 RepID=UPI000FF6CEF8|nr:MULTISPECIES: nitrilase-related carbon-nitrogen hydrolase [unclassified Methanocalculus]MCP1663088.1 putative amidohydrolase [Methanocalculus sp. AMF5]RQD81760.1 MAG: carbon-nitrogen hydrolase family protein [Methanocalculus sp. MSAO_Arc1]